MSSYPHFTNSFCPLDSCPLDSCPPRFLPKVFMLQGLLLTGHQISQALGRWLIGKMCLKSFIWKFSKPKNPAKSSIQITVMSVWKCKSKMPTAWRALPLTGYISAPTLAYLIAIALRLFIFAKFVDRYSLYLYWIALRQLIFEVFEVWYLKFPFSNSRIWCILD